MDAILKPVAAYCLVNAAWAAAAILVSLALTPVISRRVTRPVLDLMRVVHEFDPATHSSYEHHAAPYEPEEVTRLAADFAALSRRLETAYQDMQDSLAARESANRELAVVLDGLEQRVAERTAELDAARRQAEAACRRKANSWRT